MKRVCLIVALLIVLSVQLVYSCSCPPPKPGQGVCGSDGKTYRSACLLQCAKQQRPCLRKVKNKGCGKCISEQIPSDLRTGLPYIFKPLCTQMQTGSQSVCVLTLQWRLQTGLQAKSRTEMQLPI